jgi:TPR repeat protein
MVYCIALFFSHVLFGCLNANASVLTHPHSQKWEISDHFLGDINFQHLLDAQDSNDEEDLCDFSKLLQDACSGNKTANLVNLYHAWCNPRLKPLIRDQFFPEHFLNETPYASCIEENETTKLLILLAAFEGHLEAQVLSLNIFNMMDHTQSLSQENSDDTSSDEEKISHPQAEMQTKSKNNPIAPFRQYLHAHLNTHLDDPNVIGLSMLPFIGLSDEIVKSRIVLWDEKEESMRQNASARTLLRMADKYLEKQEHKKAQQYYEEAAKKGSIRAVIVIVTLIAQRTESKETRWDDIQTVLNNHRSFLKGYGHLLPAYFYQFGSLGVVHRDLRIANQRYKKAIAENCREAAFEYGEFLISMLNTCSDDEKDKKNHFIDHAITVYEQAGDLGLTQGYQKAIATLKRYEQKSEKRQEEIHQKQLSLTRFSMSFEELMGKEKNPKRNRNGNVLYTDSILFTRSIIEKILSYTKNPQQKGAFNHEKAINTSCGCVPF